MKRTITIIAAALSLMLAGCTSFLNVETLGKSTIEGFFEDIDGLKTAGLGLHRCLLEFYDDEYLRYGDIAAGDNLNLVRVNADQGLQKIYDFDNLAEDNSGFPYKVWKEGYSVCTNANNILYYGQKLLKKFPEQEGLILKHFGYAYFCRALMIFDLCNVYAQPYDFTPDASHPGVVAIDYVPGFDDVLARHTMNECYKRIISDLEKGIECFGGDTLEDPTYISGLACEALLARVYLYMGDYDKAAKYSELVKGKVSLADRSIYVNMFRKAQDTPSEAILRMNSYDSGSGMRSLCSPVGSPDITPAPEFMSLFASDDIRKELFTYVAEKEDGEAYEGKVYTAACKYLPYKGGVKEENRRSDPFILRASEMYLIHAEAKCRLGDLKAAEDDLRAVKARAIGKNPSDIALSYSGKGSLDKLIQEERAKELCYEGHRFFDLKRRHEDVVRPASTTSTLSVLKYPSHLYALPISQMEMQTNENMTQNEGYIGRKTIGEE